MLGAVGLHVTAADIQAQRRIRRQVFLVDQDDLGLGQLPGLQRVDHPVEAFELRPVFPFTDVLHRGVDDQKLRQGRIEQGRYPVDSYPDAVASMLRIAQHRGWSGIKVSGDEAFRREVWVQGRSLGLEVAGYKPTERDRQAANEPAERAGRRAMQPTREEVKRRLDMAAVVVRTLISDPAAQARLMQQAWSRVRPETERSRDADSRTPPRRSDRGRDR